MRVSKYVLLKFDLLLQIFILFYTSIFCTKTAHKQIFGLVEVVP